MSKLKSSSGKKFSKVKRYKDLIPEWARYTEPDIWALEQIDKINQEIKKRKKFSPKTLVLMIESLVKLFEIESLFKDLNKPIPMNIQKEIRPTIEYSIKIIYRPALEEIMINHTDTFFRNMMDIYFEGARFGEYKSKDYQDLIGILSGSEFQKLFSRKDIEVLLKKVTNEEEFDKWKKDIFTIFDEKFYDEDLIKRKRFEVTHLWDAKDNPKMIDEINNFREIFSKYFDQSEDVQVDTRDWFKAWDLMNDIEKYVKTGDKHQLEKYRDKLDLTSDFAIFRTVEETMRDLYHHYIVEGGHIVEEWIESILGRTDIDWESFFRDLGEMENPEVKKEIYETLERIKES